LAAGHLLNLLKLLTVLSARSWGVENDGNAREQPFQSPTAWTGL